MAHKEIPTIPSFQLLSRDLGEFKKQPMIEWSEEGGGQESGRKIFSSGYDSQWDWDTKGSLNDTDIWSTDDSNSFEISTRQKNERNFIAYFNMENGRHFRSFTEMGFQFYQNAREKGTLYLYNIGREYKNPMNQERWSFSEEADDYNYKGDRGTFFVHTRLDAREIDRQSSGYILNRVYFHLKTNSSGSSGTGGDVASEIQIYNLKFGYGYSNSSDSYRICLPNKRPFSQAEQLSFGE